MATTETILEATIKAGVEHFSRDIKTAGLPLGHLFAWPFKTPPDGAIQCNGGKYSRTLYGEFLAYVNSKGWLKTEGEWQSIASANGGYCPYYSNGDVSTYFRTPKFAPFMQVAIASGNVGTYHQAGLPNITGTFTEHGNTTRLICTGAFTGEPRVGIESNSGGASDGGRVTMNASRSSAVYGRSNTVQPESNEWMICVVVAGQATNIGSVDVGNVMSAVAQVQASVSAVEAKPILNAKAYITEVWRSGTAWHRVWSNGWIEQGGHGTGSSCTFSKSFSNKNYSFVVNASNDYTAHPDYVAAYEKRGSRTTSSTGITTYSGGADGWDWYACGN